MKLNTILKSVAVATSFVAMGAAHAGIINFSTVGNTGQFAFFDADYDSAVLYTLVDFELTSISATTATFDVDVTNLSTGAGLNIFSGFGIKVVSPSLSGASASGSTWFETLNTSFPGYGTVSLCSWSGSDCSGYNGAGLTPGVAEGGSSSFVLTLTTGADFTTSGISFIDPYYGKFENAGDQDKSAQVRYYVPEPSSIALTGLLLTGLAASRRLAKRKSA
jgi:hypothetical protein